MAVQHFDVQHFVGDPWLWLWLWLWLCTVCNCNFSIFSEEMFGLGDLVDSSGLKPDLWNLCSFVKQYNTIQYNYFTCHSVLRFSGWVEKHANDDNDDWHGKGGKARLINGGLPSVMLKLMVKYDDKLLIQCYKGFVGL